MILPAWLLKKVQVQDAVGKIVHELASVVARFVRNEIREYDRYHTIDAFHGDGATHRINELERELGNVVRKHAPQLIVK